MKTLYEAILEARKTAKKNNTGAVVLYVLSNGCFEIGGDCLCNTKYSMFETMGSEPARYPLTVSKDSIFDSLISFDFLVFCVEHTVRIK